jgi:hypothetical protein
VTVPEIRLISQTDFVSSLLKIGIWDSSVDIATDYGVADQFRSTYYKRAELKNIWKSASYV